MQACKIPLRLQTVQVAVALQMIPLILNSRNSCCIICHGFATNHKKNRTYQLAYIQLYGDIKLKENVCAAMILKMEQLAQEFQLHHRAPIRRCTTNNDKSRHLHTSKSAYAPKLRLIHSNDRLPLHQQPVIKRESNERSFVSCLLYARGTDVFFFQK